MTVADLSQQQVPKDEEGRPNPSADPFAGRLPRDVLRVRLKDGRVVEGSYLTQAGMHFIHVRGQNVDKVEGPYSYVDVASVLVLKGREEVIEDYQVRKRGDLVPGRLTRTRDGYEARLETLARYAARADKIMRRIQIEYQFDQVADEIELARTKRNWMLAVAKWALHSNEEPDKLAMSGGDMTSAERLQRPRPQDFDPDPKVRRARFVWPDHIVSDPISPPNMMKALRDAGFNARVSVIGEVKENSAELLVDFPGGRGAGRFFLAGKRGEDGAFAWRHGWEGNGTGADLRRQYRCLKGDDYSRFRHIVATGLPMDAPEPDDAGPAPCF